MLTKYELYQLDEHPEICFQCKKNFEKGNMKPDISIYKLVFSTGEGPLFPLSVRGDKADSEVLEDIFSFLNSGNVPFENNGRSMSVSDVAVLYRSLADGGTMRTAYFCDSIGFTEEPGFFDSLAQTSEKTTRHASSETSALETKITISFVVTNSDIDDIMETALDSGISYWCCKATPNEAFLGKYASEQISRGGSLTLQDAESGESWVLDKGKLVNGIKLYFETSRSTLTIVQGRIDTGDIDAEAADLIVQYSLFGEQMFS